MSTHHEMKKLPISSTKYLIKGTTLNAEWLNKSVMLERLITKLLKGRKPAVIYTVLNFQLLLKWLTENISKHNTFHSDYRKCFSIFKNHSLRPIPYCLAIRLQNTANNI